MGSDLGRVIKLETRTQIWIDISHISRFQKTALGTKIKLTPGLDVRPAISVVPESSWRYSLRCLCPCLRAKKVSISKAPKQKAKVNVKVHADHGTLVEAGGVFVGVSKKVHKNENAVHKGGLLYE